MLNSKSDVFQKKLRPPAHTIHIHSHIFPPMTLVGGLEHFFMFPYIGNVIIPTDSHIFQRGRSVNHQPEQFSPCGLRRLRSSQAAEAFVAWTLDNRGKGMLVSLAAMDVKSG